MKRGSDNQIFLRFAHLLFAAFSAISRRCSGVMVSNLRWPPILPPLRPILHRRDASASAVEIQSSALPLAPLHLEKPLERAKINFKWNPARAFTKENGILLGIPETSCELSSSDGEHAWSSGRK